MKIKHIPVLNHHLRGCENRESISKRQNPSKKWILYYRQSFCVTFQQLVQAHILEKCAAIAISEPSVSIWGNNTFGNGELSFFSSQPPEFLNLNHWWTAGIDHQKPKGVLGENLMETVIQEQACNESQVRLLLFKPQWKEENPRISAFSMHNIKTRYNSVIQSFELLPLHFIFPWCQKTTPVNRSYLSYTQPTFVLTENKKKK